MSPDGAIAAASAPLPGVTSSPVIYRGMDERVLVIALGNAVLSIATLGFYRFWAKTRLRRYLWSSIRIYGEPLEYTGTGRELFYGFLVAIVVLGPVLAVIAGVELLFEDAELLGLRPSIAVYIVIFMFLTPYAAYRVRRYQMTRTVWRGIRFAQSGSALRYAAYAMAYSLLAIATLFIAAPFVAQRLQGYLIRNTWFGDRRFEFSAPVRPLFWHWLKSLALAIPTSV